MRPTISKLKLLIPACALIGALALAPGADAGKKTKTHKLAGSVEGDANSKVTMKVKVKNRKPKKVKSFAWENLDGFCSGAPAGEQSGTLSQSTGLAALNSFRVFGPYDQATSVGDVVDISGFVRRRGKKIADGLISVSFKDGFCSAPVPSPGSGSFTATKQ
jgi:hypothetical protein